MHLYIAGTYAEIWNGGGRLDGLLIRDRGSFEDVSGCDVGWGEPPEYKRGGFDLDVASRVNILESFFYVADWQTESIHRFKSFMLDSGAFTFAYGSKEQVDLDSYLKRYIEYINENDVELFFELDVDKLVGYQRVLEYRRELELGTGKRCIPVWHLSRGKDEWVSMAREYDYIALGGLAAHEFKNQEKYIPWFTRTAHEYGCKVHGLGYTKLPSLPYMGFDSVDSSAWLVGNRGGFLYRYNHDGCRMAKIQAPKGKRLDARLAARHNFMQWVELAEYLED